MSKRYGVWIDHRRAFLVQLTDEGPETSEIASDVERRSRAGGSRTSVPYGPQDAFPEDRMQRKHDAALKAFYGRVAKALESADEIYVMGPGEAKGEFNKVLGPLTSRVVATEPADKMTDPQAVARIRAFYEELHGPD